MSAGVNWSNYRGVLFDLDGTLVNSLAAVDRAWGAFCLRHGLAVEAVLSQIHGRRSIDSIRALLPQVDADEEDAWIRNREATDTEGVLPVTGALDLLQEVSCPWTVVTSGTAEVARARMRAAGIPETPGIVFGDDVVRGKPAPDPFLLGAERLGIEPSRCLVFEDTVAGIRSAHASNMKVIALTTSNPASDLTEADAVIDDYRDVEFSRSPKAGCLCWLWGRENLGEAIPRRLG